MPRRRSKSCRSGSCARSPTTAISTGIAAAAREARAHGFDGATCVHPSAVPLLNAAFSADADEIAWAERVVAAAHGQTAGAFSLDGKMVERR